MATQAPSATIDQLIISSPYDEPASIGSTTARRADSPANRVAARQDMCAPPTLPSPLMIPASSLNCRW